MASFLITDVRIFDGESIIAEAGSVLVDNGKITKISTKPIPFEGTTISKPGHTLLPGLIDAHVHIDFGSEKGLEQGLRFGVTTMCDLGNAAFQITRLKEMVSEGNGSDLKAAMESATPEGGWPGPLLEKVGVKLPPSDNPLQTADDGKKFVQEQLQNGADYIKLLHESGDSFGMQLPLLPEIVEKSIISECHSSKKIVLAHAFSLKDALQILSLGVDGMAHVTVEPPTEELLEAYKRTGAFCIPTLCVIGSSTGEGKERQEKFAGLLGDEGEREGMCKCIAMTDKRKGSLGNAVETVKRLKEAGIDIVCGTDSAGLAPGTSFGLSLHQELDSFVEQCGFSPLEALRSATSVTAKRFGFADRGWIKEGMRADLVLVEGDPTEEIGRTLDLRGVWVEGRICGGLEGKL